MCIAKMDTVALAASDHHNKYICVMSSGKKKRRNFMGDISQTLLNTLNIHRLHISYFKQK